ncbi:glycine cleavage system protein GcvH [Dissulfurirhabdus thermomarina]|uniref:Glycine cleavage system protein GcvH n=1 Tax=Dissulfurirhabdus thermomarina TaxID=1765737 RepID=A0A6N9TMV4_DISTH|nr:glycine cleavage system protein GcvH [Dissulfurirhabdus thermomarina]NDY42575.1 glycine cleavage system protein GcvH [Dissulfurirhabdus thermomarina]NMX22508.1 glycine cleavage system protein GcvH [Dissulfurirhabdus thermomarina]
MLILEDLFYTEGHMWTRPEDDGTAVVGLTEFGQQRLGEIEAFELAEGTDELIRDEVFATIEGESGLEDLVAPLSGRLLAVNEAVLNHPSLVNTDPYEDGWLVRLEPSNPEELDDLLSPEEYAEYLEEVRMAEEEDDEVEDEEEFDE